VALGAFLLGLWLVVLRCVRRGSIGLMNVPHPEYWKTPEREPELRRRMEADLTWFFAATVLLLAAIPVSTVAAAGRNGLLPWGFQVVLGLYLLGTVVWCGFLLTRRYRPPAGSGPAG
jgi:nitrate reductase NapE component